MLFDVLQQHARKQADAIALVQGDRRVSYAEFERRVISAAAGLHESGIRQSVPTAILLSGGIEFATAFFALARLGAVAVPLNPELKDPELVPYLREAGIRHIITVPEMVQRCLDICSEHTFEINVTTLIPDDTVREMPPVESSSKGSVIDPDAVFLYQYSSGTTGVPKRITRTQGQYCREGLNLVEGCGLSADDSILCILPLHHGHGLSKCLLAGICSGARIVVMENPQPFILKRAQAIKLIEDEKITFFPGVPFIFEALAKGSLSGDLSSIRLCISGSTGLSRTVFDGFLEKFGLPIRQMYGATETGTISINLDPDPVAMFNSVGTTLRGVTVKILDETGGPLPANQTGDIAIRSTTMITAYPGRDDVNDTIFRDGWFLPGDRGWMDTDGRLYISGRRRAFIEVVGHKVDPELIEDVLMSHPRVNEAVVVGVRGTTETEQIKAVVTLHQPCSEIEILQYCRERLAGFEVPQVIVIKENLMKTALGKISLKDVSG